MAVLVRPEHPFFTSNFKTVKILHKNGDGGSGCVGAHVELSSSFALGWAPSAPQSPLLPVAAHHEAECLLSQLSALQGCFARGEKEGLRPLAEETDLKAGM